jgi:hypothetical protein
LEPEPKTQQSGQTPDKKVEIKNITVYVIGYTETDTTGMLTPQTVWRYSVAPDIDSNVFDLYFLNWNLSRLLCCVGSGFKVAAALRMGLFKSPRILQMATNFRVGISVLKTPLILERCRQQKREVDLLSKFGRPTGRTTRSLINPLNPEFNPIC